MAVRTATTRGRITVIGAGMVGLACAWALQQEGFEVSVIDRATLDERRLSATWAASRCPRSRRWRCRAYPWRAPRWLLDPLGPLCIRWRHLARLLPWLWRFWRNANPARVECAAKALASLLGRVYEDLAPMLKQAGIAGELSRGGCLHLYENLEMLERDMPKWRLRERHEVALERIDPRRITELEPALAPIFAGGVRTVDWGHLRDPYRAVLALASLFAREGGGIRKDEVVDFELTNTGPRALFTASGEKLEFERLVIAAGAWSGRLCARLGDPVMLEAERGYSMTLPNPGVVLNNMVASAQRMFVMTPMAMGLRVGGTAEFGGLEAPPDFERSRVLVKHAKRYLPGLDDSGGSPWMGRRSSTPDSLPVLGPSPRHGNVLYAFGHGHLGLTLSATSARILADLAAGRNPGVDLSPFRIDRF